MPETTPGGFQYPVAGDPADVPLWLKRLAQKSDEKLGTQAQINDSTMRAAAAAPPTDSNFAGKLAGSFAAKVLAKTTASNQTQELFRIKPKSPLAGDFRLIQRDVTNSDATVNSVTYQGWNVGDTHDPEVPSKPAMAFGMESNFYDGSGDGVHGCEFYLETADPGGGDALFRPFYTRGSWEPGHNRWTTHFDIGTDGAGHLDIYAGKLAPVLFTVAKAGAQFTVPVSFGKETYFDKAVEVHAPLILSPTSGQALALINTNAGPGPVVQLAIAGVPRWNLFAEGGATFKVTDQDGRAHSTYSYNADPDAALSLFSSRLHAQSDIEVLNNGRGLIAKSPNGTRYRLVPPNGGGAATWAPA